MSKTIFYRQCRLSKKESDVTFHQTSWIPETFAVVGKTLRLRENGQWQDGWVVQAVGATSLSEDLLPDTHDDIKGHRRASGDSLPK
jgi:hypothetical protein